MTSTDFPFTYKAKPRSMTCKQWHWLRRNRPADLAAIIRDAHRPAALIGEDQ